MKHRSLLETLEALDPNIRNEEAEVEIMEDGERLSIDYIKVTDEGYQLMVSRQPKQVKGGEYYER